MVSKGEKRGWGWAGVQGKDPTSKQIYIYITYTSVICIIFTKHILRHVKQHKEPAL